MNAADRSPFTTAEVELLVEALNYQQAAIRDAQHTPYAVRQENLARVDVVLQKLRTMRSELRGAE